MRVYLRLETWLRMADLERYLEIEPVSWTPELAWQQGVDTDGNRWAQAPLPLKGLRAGDRVQITFRRGLPDMDGAVLAQDVSYLLQVAVPLTYSIRVTGLGLLRYDPAVPESQEIRAMAPDGFQATVDFSAPPDRREVEQRVQEAFYGEPPDVQMRWDSATRLQVAAGPWNGHAALHMFGVTAPGGAPALSGPLLTVYASAGWQRVHRWSEAGDAALPVRVTDLLVPSRMHTTVSGDKAVLYHLAGGACEYEYGSWLVDLMTGAATEVRPVSPLQPGAQWLPDGPLLGVAIDPRTARLAAFVGRPDETGYSGAVDLVILTSAGDELRRIPAVSLLKSSDTHYFPVTAAWLPDGRLVYTGWREDNWAPLLAVADPDSGEWAVTDIPAGDVGGVLADGRVVTQSAGAWGVRPLDGGPFAAFAGPVSDEHPVAVNPAGTRVVYVRAQEVTVWSAETGQSHPLGRGVPVGWDAGGALWWLEATGPRNGQVPAFRPAESPPAVPVPAP